MRFTRILAWVATSIPLAALVVDPSTAGAIEVGAHFEPGVAVPLVAPQAQRFDLGGAVSLKAYLGLGRYFDVQGGVSYVALAAAAGTQPSSAGTAWSDSLGLRFKRPHDASPGIGGFRAASPWVDADVLYVRTGPLDRFGVTAGAGVSFPIGLRRNAWLGPFVRFMDIVQPDNQNVDNTDAKLLLLGLRLEVGTSPLPRRPQPIVECPACVAVIAVGLPDRDHDTVLDATDLCPDVAGPVENGGCPVYKKIIIKPDRLELREKIMFAFDQATIETESLPLLDEVAQALNENKGFHVEIEGHTDSTGKAEHNQELSEGRAKAVLRYIRERGVAADRLSYKGFGSSEPTETNATVAGRENNRRVEFVVQLKIVDRSTP